MYLENKKDNSVVGKCIYVVQTKLSVLSPFIQTPEKDKRKKRKRKKKERKRKHSQVLALRHSSTDIRIN